MRSGTCLPATENGRRRKLGQQQIQVSLWDAGMEHGRDPDPLLLHSEACADDLIAWMPPAQGGDNFV